MLTLPYPNAKQRSYSLLDVPRQFVCLVQKREREILLGEAVMGDPQLKQGGHFRSRQEALDDARNRMRGRYGKEIIFSDVGIGSYDGFAALTTPIPASWG